MAKLTTPLTSTQIDAAKSKDKDYSLFDGRGLILLVRTSGTKTWRYKYKNFLGTQIVLTLGKYPALKLQQARALRTEFERMLANGEDPKEQQVLKKAKANNANSLESITRNWLDSYAIRKPLSEESKHKRLRKFENHLFPKFKNKAIDQIKLHELKNTLNTIYKDSPDNAQRIRADLISIFGYAL
ncbi:tyrosine-type recombinase/integrase [Acinetobacter higginsii]